MKRRIFTAAVAFLVSLTPLALIEAQAAPARAHVVIAFDASGSMSGQKLKVARAATINFVQSIPADIKVSLVVFSTDARIRVPLTFNRSWLVESIKGIKAEGNTALFDAMSLALNELKQKPSPHIVVLSDGSDTTSRVDFADIKQRVTQGGTPLSIIALNPEREHKRDLQTLADASGGQLLTADRLDELVVLFQQVLPTPTASPSATLSPSPSATATPVVQFTMNSDWPRYLAVAVFVALMIWLFASIRMVAVGQKRKEVSHLLQDYSEIIAREPRISVSVREFIRQWLSQRLPKTVNSLDQARVSMTVENWISVWLILSSLVYVYFQSATGNSLFSFIVASVGCWLLARLWLRRGMNRARQEFEEGLPSTLALLASSLRSGLTFAQALDTVVQEGSGEIARQFRRALLEVKVGNSLEDALVRVAERMKSEDLAWTVTGLMIQREVGGSLSKILDTSAETISRRAELRREVRTLSAEGRLSAYVLAGLPVVIFLFLLATRPQYIAIFWSEPIGIVMMIAMLAAFATGWVWVNKLVKVEV